MLLSSLGSARSTETAGYGPWHSGRIRGGGYVQNVVFSPSDPARLYAYVDVAGAFRSDDGGRSWRMLHGGLPADPAVYACRSLAVDPRDADVLLYAAGSLAGSPQGLFRSTDGGTSWTRVLTTRFLGNEDYRWAGTVLERSPDNPDLIVAATAGDGAWFSEDNGLTWTRSNLPSGLMATDLDADPAQPGRFWLCASRYRAPYDSLVFGLTHDDRLLGGLWRSDDSGRTWTRMLAEGPEELVVNAGRLIGIFDLGASLRASGDGETWSYLQEGLPLPEIRPEQPGSVPTAEWPNVTATPSHEAMAHRIHALSCAGRDLIAATYEGEIYRLNAGETTWRHVPRQSVAKGDWWGAIPGEPGWVHFGKAAGSLAVDPRDASRWFMTDWYAIWETTDAGADWTLRIDGVETTVLHCLLQDPRGGGVIHLGMADNGHFRSTDGGATWQLPRRGFNNTKSLASSLTAPDVLYGVGTSGGAWLAEHLFTSRDGGQHWSELHRTGLPGPGHTFNSLAAHPTKPDTVFIAAAGPAGGVFASTNGGQSWSTLDAGWTEADGFFEYSIWETGNQLAASADDSLVALTKRPAPPRRFDPTSRRWSVCADTTLGTLHSVVADPFRPGRYAAAGERGVFLSEDAGATWHRVAEASIRHVAFDRARPGRLVAGTTDGIIVSLDDGASWVVLDRRLPHRVTNSVAFCGDRIVAGSLGNGVFWSPLPDAGEGAPSSAK